MNWKFWQRDVKGDSPDYGRITDASVAWEFAHQEEATRIQQRFENERIARFEKHKREAAELTVWLSGVGDRSSSTTTRTKKWGDDNPWSGDSTKIPCVAISIVYTEKKQKQYAPCALEVNHKGDHQLQSGGQWLEEKKLPPILVHEAVGEIHGPEDLEQLKKHFKEEGKEAKRKAMAKFNQITALGEKYYPKD